MPRKPVKQIETAPVISGASQSTRERFFSDVLIPAGQLLEITLALIAKVPTRITAVELSTPGFEALNYASCFAVNPNNSDLSAVTEAVRHYMEVLVRALNALPATGREQFIGSVLAPARSGSRDATQSSAFRRELEQALPTLNDAVKGIHVAIGYDPALQAQWLSRNLVATPLTKNRKLSAWRTLVRNSDWHMPVRLLKLTSFVPASQLTVNAFSSHEGRQKLPQLWADTFGVTRVEGATDTRLPVGVTVQSTVGGRLIVAAQHEPRSELTSTERKAVQAKASSVPETLALALQAKRCSEECDYRDLSEVVLRLRKWLSEQKASDASIRKLYTQWQESLRVAALRTKFEEEFSEEDRALLLKGLSDRPFAVKTSPAAKKTVARKRVATKVVAA